MNHYIIVLSFGLVTGSRQSSESSAHLSYSRHPALTPWCDVATYAMAAYRFTNLLGATYKGGSLELLNWKHREWLAWNSRPLIRSHPSETATQAGIITRSCSWSFTGQYLHHDFQFIQLLIPNVIVFVILLLIWSKQGGHYLSMTHQLIAVNHNR